MSLALLFGLYTAEMQLLVHSLGDEQFAIRQRASNFLAQRLEAPDLLLWLALPVLEEASKHADPEIGRRAQILLDDFYANVGPTYYRAYPWIDMLPSSYPDRQRIVNDYLNHARALIGSHGGEWPDYRYATQLFIQQSLRSGLSRHSAQTLLDAMVEQERFYRKQRGLKDLIPP
jgi:hypothetical protein